MTKVATGKNLSIYRPCSNGLKASSAVLFILLQLVVFVSAGRAEVTLSNAKYIVEILDKMKTAYVLTETYQTETEVKVYPEGKPVETERFLYTFKKPDHIRIDMESPYSGMVLIYPGEDGKVTVKLGGLFSFLKLHLSPGDSLLNAAKGQRIDQTDMGLLIKNIAHSLTDKEHGEVRVSEQQGLIRIEVLAEDHFLAGVLTLYHFIIDKALWLPVEVREFTPNGILKREVRFRNLRTSPDIKDSFFQISGGSPAP